MLPVEEVLPSLVDALAGGTAAVLVAPPGAGKSTLAPLRFLNAPWMAGRKILMARPDVIDGWLTGVTTRDGAPGAEAVKAALGL